MKTIATVGYEGLSLSEFLSLLKRCKIARIVDVREMPISRKRGFGKTALMQALKGAGVSYSHFPELGCPRNVRHIYRENRDWNWYTIQFKKYLETQNGALQSVLEIIGVEPCALLCFERDFNFCHRTYVAEQLVDLCAEPLQIEHLTGPIKGRVVVREPVFA